MQTCERCGSLRVTWFTPEHFGRQFGIFQCDNCQKLNLRLPAPGQRQQLAVIPVVARPRRRR